MRPPGGSTRASARPSSPSGRMKTLASASRRYALTPARGADTTEDNGLRRESGVASGAPRSMKSATPPGGVSRRRAGSCDSSASLSAFKRMPSAASMASSQPGSTWIACHSRSARSSPCAVIHSFSFSFVSRRACWLSRAASAASSVASSRIASSSRLVAPRRSCSSAGSRASASACERSRAPARVPASARRPSTAASFSGSGKTSPMFSCLRRFLRASICARSFNACDSRVSSTLCACSAAFISASALRTAACAFCTDASASGIACLALATCASLSAIAARADSISERQRSRSARASSMRRVTSCSSRPMASSWFAMRRRFSARKAISCSSDCTSAFAA